MCTPSWRKPDGQDYYCCLYERISSFVNLDFERFDLAMLKQKLLDIGAMDGATGEGASEQGGVTMETGADAKNFAVTIYHNLSCGTSRNTLALIRNAGIEPIVIEYLKMPPTREILIDLIARMEIPVRALLREKGTPFHELNLNVPSLSDDILLDAMMAHPILINRPIIVTPNGVRLCRPSELVLDLLPPQMGAFCKKDGELVIDALGQRVVIV